MRQIFRILTFAIATVVAAACGPKFETVKGDALGTQIYTLDNGLKVYMSVNKDQPRIQTYIAVKVGSKNDPSETTGLAHYFEHLMFKGTEKFGTSDFAAEKPLLDEIERLFEVYRVTTDEAQRAAIYHQIDSISYEASKIAIPNEYDKLMSIIGASGTNAWTSADETVYTEDIPSNQIDNWAKIQADRFRNVTIRGFHTELETIYEEKNMSLTRDSRKLWEKLDEGLFPNHPYGQQTTLGSQEHLKNPSITNVKKYHDQYYVPNNIAICLSGDFNPKEMVAVIEKYFGDWEPNPNVPVLEYEQEKPIETPVVKEVYGIESENVALGWRLPGTKDIKTAATASVAGQILSNGKAGLMDINVMQAQKALAMQAFYNMQPDYSSFITIAYPKQDQTLEQLKDLALEQIELLKKGEFEDELLTAVRNEYKLSEMQALENNESRAQRYVDAFIAGVDWKEAAKQLDLITAVTKEDIVAFANEYLGENAYVVVYKRQGEDKTVQKISAPAITPIVTNRDNQSDFIKEIAAAEVRPIEPVFVDYDKDMTVAKVSDGVEILYKKNEKNDIFVVNIRFGKGYIDNPALRFSDDYLDYLGTEQMSAEQYAKKMYSLACNYSFSASPYYSVVSLSGLSENMAEAIKLTEDLLLNAQPDEEILENLKQDVIAGRIRTKNIQSFCYSALVNYGTYGADYVRNTTLDNQAVLALSSEDLLNPVKELFDEGQTILYYGPMSLNELKSALSENHKMSSTAVLVPEREVTLVQTNESSVLMSQYDAQQIYYMQYSNRGEKNDPESNTALSLYNEYFGSGMNSVVFQEMREARGLAYSSWANLYKPSSIDGTYYYRAFIATQNDKMQQAIEAFDDIINNMPESEAAFIVAKEAMIGRLRTERTIGIDVLSSYFYARKKGKTEPEEKMLFEQIQDMTLEDVVAAQQKWIKDRPYTYMILGDIKDLNTKFLSTLGPVKVVSSEEIFGY